MTSIRNPDNPPVAPGLPTPASTRLTRQQPSSAMPGMQAFGANNNLIGTQINPTSSAYTNQMQGAASNAGRTYQNFQFAPFQGVGQMNFAPMQGMLTGANTSMQGLGYNFGGANQQYGTAQSQLANAAGMGTQSLQGLQGLGIDGFSGGGANLADFTRAEQGVDRAVGTVDAALAGLGNFQYAGDTMQARGFVVPALERAMNAPDRNALAAESLALLEERSNPGYQQALRRVGERNAAMGRRGSGITTNELGDVTLARERELGLARRDLANEASSRRMQDNVDRTNLALGVTQGLGSEDRSAEELRQGTAGLKLRGADTQLAASGQLSNNAQFNASQSEAASQRAARGAQFGADFQRGLANDIYGMGRDQSSLAMDIGDRYGTQERDRVGLGERQADFQRGIGNDLANFEQSRWRSAFDERNAGRDDEFNRGNFARNRFTDFDTSWRNSAGEDRAKRNELRGERDYQYGLSQDALDNEFRTLNFEEMLRGNRYNRARGYLGDGGDSSGLQGALGNTASIASGNAADAYGAAGSFMAELGRQNRRQRQLPPAARTTYDRPRNG